MLIEAHLLLSPIGALSSKLASPAFSELVKLYGFEGDIEKLKWTLKRLQATLHDAEQLEVVEGKQQFMLWLQEIKTAYHVADDVLDELEYEHLRRSLEERRFGDGGNSLFSTLGMLCEFCSSLCPKAVCFRYKMARKIENIRKKLDEITKDKHDFKFGGIAGGRQPEFERYRETTALLADPEVFGRDEMKNKLTEWLLRTAFHDGASSSSSSHCPAGFSVLSICGMGGLGKTTLAKLVFNTEQVKGHFHVKMWVFVSKFDLVRQTKDMLQQINPQASLQNTNNLHILQQDLSEKLKGKLFLLILDDVWEEDQMKWREFSAPLAQGGKGSKVLITTRSKNVANILKPEKIELEILSFDDCWSIFKKHAFTDAHSSKLHTLECIGKEIVRRLNGIPLAAVAIGCLLGFESDERKWTDVLNNELWKSEQGGHNILPALKLSYEYLPLHLKECFTYCCVFPKGCEFSMMGLVQLWIAQGYVPQQGNRSVEDVGKDCIEGLLNRSLIIKVVNYDIYFIHDLLHDLGQEVLKHEYHRMGLDQVQEVPEDAHSKIHLTVNYPKPHEGQMEILHKFKSLRTLSFWFHDHPYIRVPIDLFYTLTCLRVLDLSYSDLDTLPDSVGCLKHLRYIDLRKTNIECLPESLCALYKLQTLKLDGCEKLNTLPSGMSNLVNLHYLEAKNELISKISQIGKLIHLQYLKVFSISDENKNRVGDLKNMKELRGTLTIQNLERVNTREEAAEATLENLQYLKSLEIQWADDQNINQTSNCPADSVIEGLQPPQSLKELTIKYYPGISIPKWMNNVSISSLESLCLRGCENMNPFPLLGQWHSLKTLQVTGCPQLKELSQLPPALENLILQQVGLVVLDGSLHDLQRLILHHTLQLKELPLLPFTLRVIEIEGVGLQALPELRQGCEISMTTSWSKEEGKSSDSSEPALSILKIHACPHLTTLDEGMLKQQHLRHLKVLSIKGCKELVDWPTGDGFQSTLSSLDWELCIESCPILNALPEGTKLHPSLKKLVVKDCPRVPDELMFSQAHNLDDVLIRKYYLNFELCVNEALRQLLIVELLDIVCVEAADDHDELDASANGAGLPVLFKYDMVSKWDWRRNDRYMARRVGIVRRGEGRRQATADDDDGSWLRRCLDGHPWTSSLRHLRLQGIPGGTFSGVGHPLPPLHSLEDLWFWHCREMRRLPSLSHLTALRDFRIFDCPALTLSSVDVGIRSVPSLELLQICQCPQLAMPSQPSSSSSSPIISINSDPKDGSAPPPAGPAQSQQPPAPPLPRLLRLIVDDVRPLARDGQHSSCSYSSSTDQNGTEGSHLLGGTLLTSLRLFSLRESQLTSLMSEEGVLRTLAPSLQGFLLSECPNLEYLPADLRGLLPNLKLLCITKCPKLRRLKAEELPASLEELQIHECPEMELLKIARHEMAGLLRSIPVCLINDVYITGSSSKSRELRANWDFQHCIGR